MIKMRAAPAPLFLLVLAMVAGLLVTSPSRAAAPEGGTAPNILLIVSDDQRAGTMDYMPLTKARIFEEGVTFDNALVTTPLCCPSRASILTGMYAHNHGVYINEAPLRVTTLAERLNDAGYYTGIFGKYLNSWDGTPRPEYDYWTVFPGGTAAYNNPVLNINGTEGIVPGYLTHLLAAEGQTFLALADQQPDPFLMIFTPYAPHRPAIPAPGDENLYPNLPLHRPPSYNEPDASDKPAWLSSWPLMTLAQQLLLDGTRRRQLQTLNSLDQAVDGFLTTLEQQGKLDNTVVIYLSDNGLFWGEHRQRLKSYVYDEAVRVPFALRYPPLVPTPHTESALIANIDIAPTLYELAGVPIPEEVDGRSLVPLLQGGQEWRSSLVVENWYTPPYYRAIHNGDYVYVETPGDRSEFYALNSDPYQLDNLIDEPLYQGLIGLFELTMSQERRSFPADDTEPAVVYDGWVGREDNAARGGSYRAAAEFGRLYHYRTPLPVSQVGVISYRGPDQGKAVVLVDGVPKGEIDLYAPTPEYGATFTFSGLTTAVHTVTVLVRGQKNPLSTGTEVRVDGMVYGATAVDDRVQTAGYGRWAGQVAATSFMGGYQQSGAAGAAASYTFESDRVSWGTILAPWHGQADVYVDDVWMATVDLYSPTISSRSLGIEGLGAGVHTLKIVVRGTRHPASLGTTVVLDAFRPGPWPSEPLSSVTAAAP